MPLRGERRRRRLRHPRRALPRGLPDPVRLRATRSPGEMDRGPARAPAGGQPLAPGHLRAGDRGAQGRHAAGPAGAGLRRHGRLRAHPRRSGALLDRGADDRPLPDPQLRGQHPLHHDQQDRPGHAARTRAGGVVLLPRTHAGHDGQGPRPGSGGAAAKEPGATRRDPVRDRLHPAKRPPHHPRQRRLSERTPAGAGTVRVRRDAGATGPRGRRPVLRRRALVLRQEQPAGWSPTRAPAWWWARVAASPCS